MDATIVELPRARSAAYPIPDAALDDRLAWIGTAGSGKTYNAGAGVERLLTVGARVVIVDPLDVWWGLRLNADGEAPAFPLVIFGGAHGDMPLNEHAGALIGETVATMAESCIVSLGGLQTKAAERRFMLAFLDAIYRKADPAKGGPFHVVFDEADLWAPQRALEPALQSRMEEIVRRGRVKGFIPWLITQRPAVLSKDVLSQADGLIAFKLTSSHDRDAVGGWIEGQADRAQGREILGSLPTMQRGQGVIWVPGRGILQTVAFPPKATFDSSRTPKRGEVRRDRSLKPLDLSKLKDRLASIEDETKANDPRALKGEIARLTRDLAKAGKMAPGAPDDAALREAENRGYSRGKVDGYAEGVKAGSGAHAALLARLQPIKALIADLESDAPKVEAWVARSPKAPRATPPPAQPPVATAAAWGVTIPQQRVLNALAWWKAFGIAQPTNEQVGFIAGYSPSSGGFANLKGGLRSLGLVDYPAGGKLALTDAGAEKAEAPTLAITREAFHAAVRAKLAGPQVRVLDPIIAAYPNPISSQEVADIAGYSAGSGGFANLRGSLRTIGLIDYPTSGHVRAADWLFP